MKTILLSGVLLLSTNLIANEADELGEINIVDESAKSALYQKEKIVGCDDYGVKELTCAKEPKAAILSKLPSSQQLTETNLKDENKKEKITLQLKNILDELNQLKKEQQADRATIKELKGLITVLSDKKPVNTKKEVITIKKSIQKISKKETSKHKSSGIKRAFKEIYKTEEEVIIEVQNNESLSSYAQYYYGDKNKYYKIYKANKERIGTNLQIMIGQQLRIPLK